MSTTLATKNVTETSSRIKGGMVAIFYLLTFLTGGFFLFAGGRLGLSLAMVLRVTNGMLTALASLAPEPTASVTEAPPFAPLVPFVAVGAGLGRPAIAPGCMLEIPPVPMIANDVGMAPPVKPPE